VSHRGKIGNAVHLPVNPKSGKVGNSGYLAHARSAAKSAITLAC
jgi:hypothetical protein